MFVGSTRGNTTKRVLEWVCPVLPPPEKAQSLAEAPGAQQHASRTRTSVPGCHCHAAPRAREGELHSGERRGLLLVGE